MNPIKELNVTTDQIVNRMRDNLNTQINADHFLNRITSIAEILYKSGDRIQSIALINTIFPIGIKASKEYCETNFID